MLTELFTYLFTFIFVSSRLMYSLKNGQLYSTIYAYLAYRRVKKSNKHKLCCIIVDFNCWLYIDPGSD